jgi:transforming growth factor-beta-induced protein
LITALERAELVGALQAAGPFTVFAPSDDAFRAFERDNPGLLAGLGRAELATILSYHVVSGSELRSTQLRNGQLTRTLAGPVVAIDIAGGAVRVNDAVVSGADVAASNGVIHVIDRVLLPPDDLIEVAASSPDFSVLAQALSDAELVETLRGEGPFTVFAPTNAAFEALAALPAGDALADVLTYHVLAGIAGPLDLRSGGARVMVNGAPVQFQVSEAATTINDARLGRTNIVASNGVMHVIDAVIVPPADDIVSTAIGAGNFTALAAALTSAGLVETLQGQGPFTVFAPTDAAFDTQGELPSGDALADVLLYHVVDGAIGSGDLSAGRVTMLSGGPVTIALEDGVRVNDATVTTADILTRNGIIHVIDRVLLPQ